MAGHKLDRITPQALAGNPRASLPSWLRYEPIVKAAMKHHPRPYIYRPSNRTAATVCSQLRDAVRGKLAFEYPSEINATELLRWYSEVVIKHDKESVYIGLPESVQAAISGHGTADATDTTFKFDELTFEEVSAFTCLLSTGRIFGPVIIMRPPDLTTLPDRPNVERITKPDGSLVLL